MPLQRKRFIKFATPHARLLLLKLLLLILPVELSNHVLLLLKRAGTQRANQHNTQAMRG
jgi:hypothetical protein